MAKHRIDELLQRTGDRRSPAQRGAAPAGDTDEVIFSPLPAVPSHQGVTAEKPPKPEDSAVDSQSASAVRGTAGADDEIVFEYEPDDADQPETGQTLSLAQLLRADDVVSLEALSEAEQIVKQDPSRTLVDILLERGSDETAVQAAVAKHAGIPFERIDLDAGLDGGFDGRLLQRLTPDFCKINGVLPLRTEGTRVVVGSVKPDNVFVLDEVKGRLGVSSIKLVIVTWFDIRGVLEILGEDTETDDRADLSSILEDVEESDVAVADLASGKEVDLEQQAGESPVIRYVNYIIQTAIKEGASDIHIEPGEKKLKVRFRIDGVLFEMLNPPGSMAAAITSRLKIMANLDISERRIPQDGRIRCTVQGRKLDLRVSTLPNGHGEKTVMRILDTRSINVQLEDLGFDPTTHELWSSQIKAPHGILLVTGPTGSGKTTTLYSSLRQLDKNKLNISTVEDPVEYHLDGITQTQMHEKIGMTFGKALKALLRQDPDVIMLGEIRDMETAHTAVQAALTGHLVLSTLHTNDAPSSITRLVNIGLEPFLVGAAINAVLAQRLVRRLCPHCRTNEEPTEEMAEYLDLQGIDPSTVWTPHGCERCRNTGYAGRVGIYEMLTIDDQVRDIIARNPNVAEFRRLCVDRGMVTLRADGLRKVKQGLTTVQEIFRVTEAAI